MERDDTALGDTLASSGADDRKTAAAAAGETLDGLPTFQPSSFAVGEEIGRGGLGRVVRATDPVFDRPIAIKELLTDHPAARARFLREAMITARLQHPAIIPIYLAGKWPDGAPFYGMKLISGKPLSDVLRAAGTLAGRLAALPSVIAACEAVAFAHRQRVIHRDLKPANVLVGELGETLVIDWGLAKDLDAADDDAPASRYQVAMGGTETIDGAVLGTPVYMAPEQAAGGAVDARADVYALGAMMYELLTGAPPYRDATSARDVLERLRAGPPPAIADRAPDAPRDLVAIAERAMAREPSARYPDAAAIVDDLRRFQTGQLVSVRTYGATERALRWARKHRAAVAVGAIAALALAVVGVVAISRVIGARRRADHAAVEAEHQRARAVAEAERVVVVQAAGLATTDPTAALAWLKRLAPGSPTWSAVRAIVAEALEGGVSVVLPSTGYVPDWVSDDGTRVVVCSPSSSELTLYDVQTGTARRVALPSGGRPVAVRGVSVIAARKEPATSWVVDASTGSAAELAGATRNAEPRFSAAGDSIIGSAAEGVRIWPLTGGAGRSIGGPAPAMVALERDGTAVMVIGSTDEVRMIGADGSTRRWRLPAELSDAEVRDGNPGIDHELVFIDADLGRVEVIDLTTGAWSVLPGEPGVVAVETTDHDILGRRADGTAIRWARDGSRWVEKELGAQRRIWAVGDSVIGWNGSVVWAFEGPDRLEKLFTPPVGRMTLSPDHRFLTALTVGGSLRRWELTPRPATCAGQVVDAADDNRYVLLADPPGALTFCDPITGARTTVDGVPAGIIRLFTSEGGQRVIAQVADGAAVVIDASGREPVRSVPAVVGQVRAISNDGARILERANGDLVVLDSRTGATLVQCPGMGPATSPATASSRLAISGDLLTAADTPAAGGVVVCDLATGQRVEIADTLVGRNPQFSPDGAVLAVLAPPEVELITVATRARVTLDLRIGRVVELAWSGDSQRLAVGGDRGMVVFDRDGTVLRRVNLDVGVDHIELDAHGARAFVIGTATAPGVNGSPALLDVATGRVRLLPSSDRATDGGITPDGTAITLHARGLLRWDDSLPADDEALRRRVEAATDATIDDDGTLQVPRVVVAAPPTK